MVDKMMKYSFILLNEETEGFLTKLQELGVVDVTRSSKPVDEGSSLMLDKVSAAKRLITKLEGISYSKDKDFEAVSKATGKVVLSEDIIDGAGKALSALADLEAEKAAAEKETAARKPWGEFDKSRLDELDAMGYTVRYYVVSKKKYSEEWAGLYPLQVVSEDSSYVWFVTVCLKGEEYSFPVEACAAPAGSWKETAEKAERLSAEIIDAKGEVLKYQEQIPAIREFCGKTLADLELYLATAATETAAEDKLSIVEGFAPVENDEALTAAFDGMGVLYIKEEAVEEDNPPIKLKNNRFVKMFESITGMYGMPGYTETDPTPVVSIFFMLFFAMCMGDAGYGIVLILFGIAMNKNWISIGMFKGLGSLIATLGAATLVVGTILGTAFGMNLYEAAWVPEALKKCMIVGDLGGYPAQMVLALGIGVFHLCLAMTIKAVGYTKRFGFKENISTWGWLILILGGIAIAALAFLGVMDSAITKWAVIILGIISGLGIFIFNTPGRNPLINIGSGLWDTYNMITGVLGDVLSYIRLYALGLAGGMLGAAFNDLALMVRGDGGLGWVFFIIILLLGHVINILMSCLGAFVHPLRLNFVEYFKNAGFDGKGRRYSPLTTEVTED